MTRLQIAIMTKLVKKAEYAQREAERLDRCTPTVPVLALRDRHIHRARAFLEAVAIVKGDAA